jgi:hypothetical protein
LRFVSPDRYHGSWYSIRWVTTAVDLNYFVTPTQHLFTPSHRRLFISSSIHKIPKPEVETVSPEPESFHTRSLVPSDREMSFPLSARK